MTQPSTGRASPSRNVFESRSDHSKSVPWGNKQDFPAPPPFLSSDAAQIKRQGATTPPRSTGNRFTLPPDAAKHIPIRVVDPPSHHHGQQQQQQPAFPYRTSTNTSHSRSNLNSNAPSALPPRTAATANRNPPPPSARAGAAPPIPPAAPQSVAKFPAHVPVQISKPQPPAPLYGNTSTPLPASCQFPSKQTSCTANPTAPPQSSQAIPVPIQQHRVPPQQIPHSPPTGDFLPSCRVFSAKYTPYDPSKIDPKSSQSQPRPFAEIVAERLKPKHEHEECPLLSIDASSPIKNTEDVPQCVVTDTDKVKETNSPLDSESSGTWQRADDPVRNIPTPSAAAKARSPPSSPPSIANRSHIPPMVDDSIKLPPRTERTEVLTDRPAAVQPLIGEPFSKGNLNPPVINNPPAAPFEISTTNPTQ